MHSEDMAAAVKRVFGDIPIEMGEHGLLFPMGLGIGGNAGGKDVRPWSQNIGHLRKNPQEAKEFLSKSGTDAATRYIQSTLIRETADKLLKQRKYKEACSEYIKAAVAMIGRDLPILGNFRLNEYEELKAHWEMADMLACANGAADCLREMGEYKQALLWAGAVEVIVKNVQIANTRGNPSFEWFDFGLHMSEYIFERLRARVTASKIFFDLGNTGAAVHRKWISTTLLGDVPKDLETPAMRKLHPVTRRDPVYKLRHPDPELVAKLSITDPELQVLGSWRKVSLKKAGGMTSRMGFASFVFEGHLYVLGGEKFLSGPWYRDFWSLDLTLLDEWRPLPSYPIPQSVTGDLVGYSMVVSADSAYLFTGKLQVDVFNIRTQEWSSISTSFGSGREAWPYPTNKIVDYAMQSVGGKIYVFGGTHQLAQVGCNLLMELDIATRKWRRLSGTAEPKADYSCPGPRRLASSWVGKDQNAIFFMYGDANRAGAKISSQMHGSMNSYGQDDVWCWDINAGRWVQKQPLGNTPSPRTEMACTYNAVLDKVVAFGGYSPTVPSDFGQNKMVFGFSFYGDTFVYGSDSEDRHSTAPSSTTATWKLVITRSFPTYRAQTHLVSDPTTGKTFLFGGYVNSEYVPSRSKSESTSFCDLWHLRLDIPGGYFEGVDVEDEALTARVGPWQRCFNCGSTGRWKKCGGTCKGQAFFCDPQCLKDGWQEHKIKHKCRKA